MVNLAALVVALIAQAPSPPIQRPPENLSFGGFYTQCVMFRGLPILASRKVNPAALTVLADRLGKMLARVPDDWVSLLGSSGSHFSIIAESEGQTDLPEDRELKNDPVTDWNKRARGLGGLTTSAGEENILEYPTDRYHGESIYVHEFAHTLASVVFTKKDPKFEHDLQAAYDGALKKGLWTKTYSASNRDEYFAEGVQMYFDCARRSIPPNGVHNEICNRSGLRAYDHPLFALVDRVYHGSRWRYEGNYNTTHLR